MELNSLLVDIRRKWGPEHDAGQMPAQMLAYVGDAVYEVFVRLRLMAGGPAPADAIHQQVVAKVRAETQAQALSQIAPLLSEEEALIVRRGRNAQSHTVRKGALAHYAQSTGFEALIGYLFLSGQKERLQHVLDIAFESGQPED